MNKYSLYSISAFLLLYASSFSFAQSVKTPSFFKFDQTTIQADNVPSKLQRKAKSSIQASTVVEDIKRDDSDTTRINYFQLTIDQALTVNASIDYQTKDGTAIAGKDYITASDTATIPAGETSIFIPVTIINDTLKEGSETFSLTISNPVGAKFPAGITEISVQHTIVDSFDTTAPMIFIVGNTSIVIYQNTNYQDAGATAIDDIDGIISVTTNGTVNSSVIGSYTLTYAARDTSGNTAVVTRNVNVIPVVVSSGGGSVSPTTTISGQVIDGEISGATVFLDLNRNGILDSDEPTASSASDGSYTLTLTAAQTAHSNYQNKKAPLIVYGGIDIRTGKAFQDYLSAIVEDNNSANITPLTTLIEQSIEDEIDQGTIATLNDMQTKMDSIKTKLADLLNIQKDLLTKNPITLAAAGDHSLINGALQLHKAAKTMKKAMQKEVRGLKKSILKTYRSLGKQLKTLQKSAIKNGETALTEALDAALDDNSLFDSQLISSVKSESKILVKAIDNFWKGKTTQLDNTALTTAIKAIEVDIVPADITVPVISLVGDNPVNLIKGTDYSDAGASAEDNVDGTLTIITTGSVDSNTVGTYTIKYNVSDSAGNAAVEVVRTINVTAALTRAEAISFLRQAAFTSSETNITALMNSGYEAWIDQQLSMEGDIDNSSDDKYGYLESLLRTLNQINPARYPSNIISNSFENFEENGASTLRFKLFNKSIWWHKALHNEDQLRQRVAYALSQILVTSEVSTAGSMLSWRGEALATYYDILEKNAFGNYRDLLKEVTLSSAMGYYLTYVGNKKSNEAKGTDPDENYARELMQLFTIGLEELNIDGSKKLDSNGKTIPTYTQDDVVELSKVFTGWDFQARGINRYGSIGKKSNSLLVPLEFTDEFHEYSAKTVLGTTIPADLTGEQDIDKALDILFTNANIAPHVSRHLIMRLVTSNPSPAYIQRVATVFNDNGQGIKGDLKAVVKTILLDPEARKESTVTHFGKTEEMLIAYTHFLDTFNTSPLSGWKINNSSGDKISAVKQYWLGNDFGQLALSADSVFNFYSPDFIPSDTNFSTNKLVSPELEIQTIPQLVKFSNAVASTLKLDKYYLIDLNLGFNKCKGSSNMDIWVACMGRNSSSSRILSLDLTSQYHLFEQALDNDTNGDFENIDDASKLSPAITALVDHLDTLLLAGTLPTDYKTVLNTYLNTIHKNSNTSKASLIVQTAIRSIVTSPFYMVIN